jgi:Xaa-Pro aminopeptidase
MVNNRLARLRQRLAELEIDAIFISQPENRSYLSGFDGSAGYLFITDTDAIIATDFRYIEQVKRQSPDYRIFQITGDMTGWFPELIANLRGKKLGFESQHISLAMYRQISDMLKKMEPAPETIFLEGLVESLRAIKDAEEIELIARAAEVSDKAFGHIERYMKTGMTEKEVAWELEKFMRERDSQAMPFDVIVASGPNAALPHAKPSERIIQEGEPVLMDFGARISGYASDLTRTVGLGEPDDEFKKVYDVVLCAQQAALELISEGMTGEQSDNLARTVIAEAGYAGAFGHALGHGVGLAAHESPRLGPGSSEKLVSGMVFTIEPGIYLPDWGGVRTEDLVVMENGNLRVLSKARKKL